MKQQKKTLSNLNTRKDNTKTRILDATLQLIWKYGITNTTTKRIAEVAGVNEVTIFRKFKNKENLIAETYKIADSIMDPLKKFLKKDFPTVEDFLNRFGLMIYKQFLKNKEVHLSCLTELNNKNSEFVKSHIQGIRAIINLFNEKLHEMHKQGKIKKIYINDLSNIYHSSIIAAMIWNAINSRDVSNTDIKNFIKSMSKIVTDGIK
ncbi:MAG: TetR/AcrR family transcriptional regulator [Spirochaetes bacterium]|nr:TetR/AcrR family transcriptional regulator [Spirochaetota bacterium]